jgi:predicted nucleic acid-binding protein
MSGARRLTLEQAREANLRCLFDTCVLIDWFNEKDDSSDRVLRGNRTTSIIALWEFLHGKAGELLGANLRKERRDFLQDKGVRVLPFRGEPSFRPLIELPRPPQVQDALLASECLASRLALVTHNIGDFEDVTGLLLVEP